MTADFAESCQNLLVLLKASAKDQVAKTCEIAFNCFIGECSISEAVDFEGIPPDTTKEERANLLSTLGVLYEKCMGLDATGIANTFPSDFHRQLRDLLIRVILQRQQDWSSKVAKSKGLLLPIIFNRRIFFFKNMNFPLI